MMEENLQDGCYFTIALILGLYSIFLVIHKRGAACIEKDKHANTGGLGAFDNSHTVAF